MAGSSITPLPAVNPRSASSLSRRPPRFKAPLREAFLAAVFILPSFIITVVFGIYPVFRAAYISLHEWTIVKGAFIGLTNYRDLLDDGEFWQALQVTVFYVVATVPLTMMVSLLLAYLLFKPIRARAFFRTLYFLPYVTAMVPAAMVWQWMFNSQVGVFNTAGLAMFQQFAAWLRFIGTPPLVYLWAILMAVWLAYLVVTRHRRSAPTTWFVGALASLFLALALAFWLSPTALETTVKNLDTFFPIRWLQEPRGILLFLGRKWGFSVSPALQGPSMALIAVSFVSMWHFIGYDMVIYMAGLYNVPPDLYEAARMDGANEGDVFWKITFPLLSPTTFFLLVISTIGAFRSFTMFYVLTAGGPLRTTMSVTYLIYDKFYTATRWGYASAIAFVLFAIILVMTLINQRLAGRRVVYQ